MAKECTLSTGKLPLGGLPRNSVVRITDHPNMTSAVYCGCKAINQTNKKGILTMYFFSKFKTCCYNFKIRTKIFEPRHEKTNNLHMRKQRRRSASR